MSENQNTQPSNVGTTQQPGGPRSDPRNPMIPKPLTPDPKEPTRRTSDPGERSDPTKQPEIQYPPRTHIEEIPAKPERDIPRPDPERS